MNEEWKETFEAVLDTNMDVIESLDSYEKYRNDEDSIKAVQNLEKVNRILREHIENDADLTNSELSLLATYTATAQGAYRQKLVLINKMVELCEEMKTKIASCLDAEVPAEEFKKIFSEKMDITIH